MQCHVVVHVHVCVEYRDISSIGGFTREVLIALSADIKSREWRHSRLPPGHPRSSTTDDVECFFSVHRDSIGKDFTMKQEATSEY